MDFVASERQYLEHLVPLWHALEPHERGTFYVARFLQVHALRAGVAGEDLRRIPPDPFGPLIVCASWKDLRRAPHRPAALLEHGVGQTYGDRHPSNPGGTHRDNVELFLCPNERVAERNHAAYPDAAVEVIGSPKMDPYFAREPVDHELWAVAVAFHWDNHQTPEARWAYPHFSGALRSVAERWETLGHGHPRAFRKLFAAYLANGIEPVEDFAEVLDRACVLVADNTSALYEFAAMDRPVVVLNAPWYRRTVSHGLRFWDYVPGLQCDEPHDLVATIMAALEDPPEARQMRREALPHAFTFTDGHSAERGAEALRRVLDSV